MVIISVTGLGNGIIQRRGAVAAHAAGELISDSDAAAAKYIRMGHGNGPVLQGTHGHWYLPGRTRWITPLDRAVVERTFFVLPIGGDLFATLRRRTSTNEYVRIE